MLCILFVFFLNWMYNAEGTHQIKGGFHSFLLSRRISFQSRILRVAIDDESFPFF